MPLNNDNSHLAIGNAWAKKIEYKSDDNDSDGSGDEEGRERGEKLITIELASIST